MWAMPRSLVVGAALAWATTAIVGRCEGSPPAVEDTVKSWDSPKVVRVKKEWNALQETYEKTPEKLPGGRSNAYDTVTEMHGTLLRNSFSDADMRALAATCGSLPTRYREWGDFERNTMRFAIEVFVDSGDRESLVRLLSTRLPLRVGKYPVEEYLAIVARGRLADPILVLAEAYSKSRVPETRAYIAAAMRRAFDGVGKRGTDDADFIKNAVERYKRERDRLAVNALYWDPDVAIPLEPVETAPGFYEAAWRSRGPLFVAKSDRGRARRPFGVGGGPPGGTGKVVDWVPTCYASDSDAAKELAKLEGTWDVIDGVSPTGPAPKERVRGNRYVFHNGLLKWVAQDGKRDELGRIKICYPLGQPQAFDQVTVSERNKEVIVQGIYELKGDILRISNSCGGWQRPRFFGEAPLCYECWDILKRVK